MAWRLLTLQDLPRPFHVLICPDTIARKLRLPHLAYNVPRSLTYGICGIWDEENAVEGCDEPPGHHIVPRFCCALGIRRSRLFDCYQGHAVIWNRLMLDRAIGRRIHLCMASMVSSTAWNAVWEVLEMSGTLTVADSIFNGGSIKTRKVHGELLLTKRELSRVGSGRVDAITSEKRQDTLPTGLKYHCLPHP